MRLEYGEGLGWFFFGGGGQGILVVTVEDVEGAGCRK